MCCECELQQPGWREAVRLAVMRPIPSLPMVTTRLAMCTVSHISHVRMWTPSDLVVFHDSPFASWMNRLVREQPKHPLAQQRDEPDAFMQMLGKKGTIGEIAAMNKLFVSLGLSIVDLSDAPGKSPQDKAAATREAMRQQPDVIYQAPLASGEFYGIADFLVRTDLLGGGGAAAGGGPATYTVWDAKLTRSPRPQQVVQLCCYAEMLEEMQGVYPESVALILGGADARVMSFRLADHQAHYRALRQRFLTFHSKFDASAEPPGLPTRGAPAGNWRELADGMLMGRDDLRLVARLSQRQAVLLQASGVNTATQLATLPPKTSVGGIDPAALGRLQRQAALQLVYRSAPEKPPPMSLLPWAYGTGLALLPPPSKTDLFFDLEGFPLAYRAKPTTARREALSDFIRDGEEESQIDEAERGREYLWGAATRQGGAGVVGWAEKEGFEEGPSFERDGEFVAWWAHTPEGEKRALEGIVDWVWFYL